MSQPSRRRKVAFWILAGMISVVFVEVPAGSTMFPFFTVWGLLVVLPLYLLHVVFLAGVVFRFGRPRFWTLYAAGTLLGMYEAYITKVLWVSFRPEGPFLTVGGIALFETILLVLFFHPMLAFVVPLFFIELLCTNSSEVAGGLPKRVRCSVQKHAARWLILLMALLGFMQFINSPSVLRSLLSGAGNSTVVGLGVLWWRKSGGNAWSLRELLPGPRGLRIFGLLLLAWYLFWGFAIRPGAIPKVLNGQLTIWMIYAVLLFVFLRCLRRSRNEAMETTTAGDGALFSFSWPGFILCCGVATAVTTISRLCLYHFAAFQVLLLFPSYVVSGLLLFTGTLYYIGKPRHERL